MARSGLVAGALLLAGCPGPVDSGRHTGERPGSDLRTEPHAEIACLAWARWTQPSTGATRIEFGVEGEDGKTSPTRDLTAGEQETLLAGLPCGVAAWVRLVVDEVVTDELAIDTEPLPEGVPTGDLLTSTQAAWDPDTRFLLTSTAQQDGHALVLDRQGRVVWARATPLHRITMQPRVNQDGTALLIDLNSFYGAFDGGLASQVVALAIDGSETARWDTPGLHHSFTDLADGSMAWAATEDDSDDLVVLDPDGERHTLWDCDAFQQGLGLEASCLSNGLSWQAESGRYLLSLFSSHSVVEIDGETGEATRWFGQLPESWTFATTGTSFWWQHGAHYTTEGTLLISTQASALQQDTVVREYTLDEDALALEQIWAFGEGEGVYGPEGGDAHRLGNGNTLHNYGSGSRIREITPEGELVWDLDLPEGTYLGRISPISDLYALWPEAR